MNNDSKVLALKYRPKIFKDLIGQEVIAETIYNSIKNNRSANAYLFTGIRGVGKTTIARIVAKALNCLNGIDKICYLRRLEPEKLSLRLLPLRSGRVQAAPTSSLQNVL